MQLIPSNWHRLKRAEWDRLREGLLCPGADGILAADIVELTNGLDDAPLGVLEDLFCFAVALRKIVPRDKADGIPFTFHMPQSGAERLNRAFVVFVHGLAGRPMGDALKTLKTNKMPDFLTLREAAGVGN